MFPNIRSRFDFKEEIADIQICFKNCQIVGKMLYIYIYRWDCLLELFSRIVFGTSNIKVFLYLYKSVIVFGTSKCYVTI